MGKVKEVGKWVPHDLTENNKMQRLNTCISHMPGYKIKDFLWKIVTGDEKWVYYDNPSNKKQWLSPRQSASASPKPDIHRKKANA